MKKKTTKSSRVEFTSGVPELLYKQAGGRCSIPRCKNPTMGPSKDGESVINMGVACHIYSAAENGPRGRGDESEEFISSAKNGIWCCSYHANLVDKKKGEDYSAAELFAWKRLAEARVRKQMNDIPSPLGWIESIEFSAFLGFKKPPKIDLSRYTLMYGPNESGKTSLLEMAASVSHSRYAERFSNTFVTTARGKSNARFIAKVIYSTVDQLSKELHLKVEGQKITRTEGNIPCLLPPGDMEVIYVAESECIKRSSEDDVDFMMRVLNVDKSTLSSLADIGTQTIIDGEIKFEKAEETDENYRSFPKYKNDGDPYYELMFRKHPRDFFVTLDALSTSEERRLILDFLITKAREVSKQRLTLLLIDGLPNNFDKGNFEALLRSLANEDFQVVVTLPPASEKNIIEHTSDGVELKKLDYLESWRLAFIETARN